MTIADRAIMHVDMDAFFASVELLRHPELRGRPVIVGGSGERGVVAAASYAARAFGVHSAMPSVRARRLCPDAVFIPGDHRHYSEVSERIMDIFGGWTPLVEPLSLDEAFLDVTGSIRLFGELGHMAARIRSEVLEQTGLHCSIGVARNKFLAKLATSRAKPTATTTGPVMGQGVFLLDDDRVDDFLASLAVEDLWGVGPVTLAKLRPIGIRTVGDLRRIPPVVLGSALGEGPATRLQLLARGIDDRPVQPDAEPKSLSHEETFAVDVTDPGELRVHLVRQADGVGSRLRRRGLVARTIHLKLRYHDFRTVTRSHTLDDGTDDTHEILEVSARMLTQLPLGNGVRLLGVGVSLLGEPSTTRQLSFDDLVGNDRFEPGSAVIESRTRDAANAVVDRIRGRFGSESIGPASLAGRHRSTGDHQWGPDDG